MDFFKDLALYTEPLISWKQKARCRLIGKGPGGIPRRLVSPRPAVMPDGKTPVALHYAYTPGIGDASVTGGSVRNGKIGDSLRAATSFSGQWGDTAAAGSIGEMAFFNRCIDSLYWRLDEDTKAIDPDKAGDTLPVNVTVDRPRDLRDINIPGAVPVSDEVFGHASLRATVKKNSAGVLSFVSTYTAESPLMLLGLPNVYHGGRIRLNLEIDVADANIRHEISDLYSGTRRYSFGFAPVAGYFDNAAFSRVEKSGAGGTGHFNMVNNITPVTAATSPEEEAYTETAKASATVTVPESRFVLLNFNLTSSLPLLCNIAENRPKRDKNGYLSFYSNMRFTVRLASAYPVR